jgi:uncharacterized protein (DUF1697 family)
MPTTWVALLRGVNVGGNTIKSADLVAAIRDAGFSRVKAVLASGNVLVEDDEDDDGHGTGRGAGNGNGTSTGTGTGTGNNGVGDGDTGTDASTGVGGPSAGLARKRAEVRRRLEAAIDARYGYGVAVAVVRLDEMQAVIGAYPFEEVTDRHPYVTFATDRALIAALAEDAAGLLAETSAAGSERLAVGDGVMYWEVAKGSSTDSPFAKISSRARYRTGAEVITTRNLRTLRKLVW